MTVLLDGSAMPGWDHRVNIAEQIERKDLSGESSKPAGSHGGWKPAVVSVRLLVDMEHPEELVALRRLFHAAETTGRAPHLYEISEPTARAMGIHRVRFTDYFRVARAQRERMWEISFSLIEEQSGPGRSEDRAADPATATGQAPANTQTPSGTAPDDFGGIGFEEQGIFEKVLTTLNAQAGRVFFNGENL